MPVAFPAIEPATRVFTPGRYPTKWRDHRGIQHVGRMWGSVGGDAQLDLTFEYLRHSETQALIEAFDNALSGYIAMTLPEQLTCGILDEDYAARIRSEGLAYSWFMPEPPKISNRSGGLSDASCVLVGYLGSIIKESEGGIWVSEVTTAVVLNGGIENVSYAQTLVTRSGSVYWCGRANDGSGLGAGGLNPYRYFLAKYQGNGNLVWGRWFLGPYDTQINTGTFLELAMCEGKNDGIVLQSSISSGGWMRVWSFAQGGTLLRDAVIQASGSPGNPCGGIFYEENNNRIYLGGSKSVAVLNATTFEPVGCGTNSVAMQQSFGRWFWLASPGRALYARNTGIGEYGSGTFLQEFSPDLSSRTQCYAFIYSSPALEPINYAMSPSGSLFAAAHNNGRVYITKHGNSAAGYAVEWTRYIQGAFPTQTVGFDPGVDIAFLSDGRMAVSIFVEDGVIIYVVSPDETTVQYTTTVSTTHSMQTINSIGGTRVDSSNRVFFTKGDFSLIGTALRLPSTGLSVGTTSTGNKDRDTVTGSTNLTPFALVAATAPTRNTVGSAFTPLTASVAGEGLWGATSFSSTATMALRRAS